MIQIDQLTTELNLLYFFFGKITIQSSPDFFNSLEFLPSPVFDFSLGSAMIVYKNNSQECKVFVEVSTASTQCLPPLLQSIHSHIHYRTETESKCPCNQYAKLQSEIDNLKTQLYHAQKMAPLGILAGGIAHDFNNILQPILGFANLAMEDSQSEKIKKYLHQILQASTHAKELTKQILNFSRRNEMERLPIQPALLLKEIERLLKHTIPANIRIDLKIRAKNAFILANQTQIHQVLMNLCTNAYQAMEKNGGILSLELNELETTLATHAKLPPGTWVQIFIRDTGAGIPKEILPRIFEAFFTTKKQGEGTGLGLSVCQSILERHEGAIFVSSEEKKGTEFEILLPRLQTESQKQTENQEPPERGHETILVLDDENSICKLLEDLLSRLGYQVITCNHPYKALEQLKSRPFDLFITDFTMPDMTGDEVFLECKKICPQMPVILISGFSRYITAETAQNLGFKSFLLKPMSTKELCKTIRSCLEPDKPAAF